MIKERPILFSAPMVRAILDGRKTQTRRIIKNPELAEWLPKCSPNSYAFEHYIKKCPYGKPGDLLWVRETHAKVFTDVYASEDEYYVEYRADTKDRYPGGWPEDEARGNPEAPKWIPSIHMRRFDSRIDLLVTGVRVERLRDISEADVLAEGIKKWPHENDFSYGYEGGWHAGHGTHTGAWRALWEQVNGPGSYDANPWVWIIEFERIKP